MGGDFIMLIILDKPSKQIKSNLGTNSLYPDGYLPTQEKQDEIYVRLHDNSEFAQQILNAYDYELILSENNEVIKVIVNKTLEQYREEQPTQTTERTLEDYVLDLEFRLLMLELGLN